MHYPKIVSLLASLASVAQAQNNIVTFRSLDDIDRTVHFTANSGLDQPPSVQVPAGHSVDVTFPSGWAGNAYAIHNGAPNTPGMLAEITFNAWGGNTFFDVSAIVKPDDKDNISELFPFDEPGTPVSGCAVFPCNDAYYQAQDDQTKSTDQTHLVCTLATNGVTASKRNVEDKGVALPRDFVLGKYKKL